MKNCVNSIEDCESTKKEIELFFHQIKFIIFERVRLKKSLLNCSATSFFSQTYTAWQILKRFVYSPIPVHFRAISISFLSFLSQKTYPGKFLRSDF